jgi:hypothetical protein
VGKRRPHLDGVPADRGHADLPERPRQIRNAAETAAARDRPERAAHVIARLATSGDVRAFVGWFRYLYLGMDRISPGLADWMLHRTSNYTRTDTPVDGDNLFEPTRNPRIRGGWKEYGWRGFKLKETARILPVETGLAALALAAGIGFLGRRIGRWG